MIESKQEVSKDLEKALQALEQAKQRVANKKKKQNEKKRKAENHHKYIMASIIVKHFPDCYSYDEGELNRILSVALSGLKKLKYDKEHEHELTMYENTKADLKMLLAEGEKITLKAWRTEREQLEKEVPTLQNEQARVCVSV